MEKYATGLEMLRCGQEVHSNTNSDSFFSSVRYVDEVGEAVLSALPTRFERSDLKDRSLQEIEKTMRSVGALIRAQLGVYKMLPEERRLARTFAQNADKRADEIVDRLLDISEE